MRSWNCKSKKTGAVTQNVKQDLYVSGIFVKKVMTLFVWIVSKISELFQNYETLPIMVVGYPSFSGLILVVTIEIDTIKLPLFVIFSVLSSTRFENSFSSTIPGGAIRLVTSQIWISDRSIAFGRTLFCGLTFPSIEAIESYYELIVSVMKIP